MHITARETQTTTLARLIRAWDHQQPVTITYVKADATETVRTIEIYDITVSAAGDIVIKAMDRESGESRSWRLDRIVSYTSHRGTYAVPRDTAEDDDAAAPRHPGLAAAGLQLIHLTTDTDTAEARVAWLADALAA